MPRTLADRTKTRPRATFAALDDAACAALLARRHIGRIAYSFHDRVDVEPISYAYEDGWIYGRTAPGSKLTTIHHSPWVAFQVDDIRGPLDWDSVVAHGTFYTLAPEGTPVDRRAWRAARAAAKRLLPEAWTDEDPAPFRTIPFRIHVAEMTGRSAREPHAEEPAP
jgi:nitroimidazol reductase NimA-like FMN-containing flavoprotein (pyridoxamine 5'-phosphate oxidase superfamily)